MKLIFWGEYVTKPMKLFWGIMRLSHDYIFGGIWVNPILTYLPTDPHETYIFGGICVNPILTYLTHVGEYVSTP